MRHALATNFSDLVSVHTLETWKTSGLRCPRQQQNGGFTNVGLSQSPLFFLVPTCERLADLLRYQNMLCCCDTMALKSLDIFSVHGFPVGLVKCESNLIGFVNGNCANVGSSGWTNIDEKYTRAKSCCDAPFEVRKQGRHKVTLPIPE
jgi:hypothetical protein